MDPRRWELLRVLGECRALLARPDNDFLWSSWEDADTALAELDEMIAGLERGVPLGAFAHSVVFVVTGPMQEVAISSGWGDEFLVLADRWDAALAGIPRSAEPAAPPECRCAAPPIDHRDFDRRELGVDEAGGRFADVAVEQCRACGRQWLCYHHENEAFSGSGRWYRGLLSLEQAARVNARDALAMLAELPWHLYGGSYFGTTGKRSDVPLDPAWA